MALARDTFLESATFTTTTPHTFTYTPVGTPRGVVLFVIYESVTDLITGTVSYGGVAMTRIPTNGHAAVTTEAGSVVGYTLGAGIPTGAQTVSIGHTGAATVKIAYVATLTAGADTEIAVSAKQVIESGEDPSVALDSSADSALRYCGLFGGESQPANYAALTGMETGVAGSSHDFTNAVAHLGQQTSPSTGSFTIGFASTGNESTALIGVAIREVTGGGSQSLNGTLFAKASTFPTGTVTPGAAALTGTLFAKAPTFPVGVVSSGGAQALTGTLFTKAPTFSVGSLSRPTFPIRQQISDFLTGTSISGVLRVAPIEDAVVFAVFSAETTLANMTGPSGYTKAVEEQGDGVSVQIWYKRAGAAESATVTATSSASVPLRIHVFECPEAMFVVGDPLDEVASNDSSTSAVTTLATGTTATVGQANTFAIAAVAALGGDLNFLLTNWSNDYTALSDHETRGMMVGYKVMTAAAAATATATWNQATAPTSHKAAAAIATFALAGPVTLPDPSPRRVSSGRIGGELNTTGTVDTIATFPVKADHLYLAFVATSKDAGNNGDAVIVDSHGAALEWVLDQNLFLGTSRRIHAFRALSGSALSAASISITTPESGCAVWWEVLELAGVFVTGGSAGAVAQRTVASTVGDTFIETSLTAVPSVTNAVVGFLLHGIAERQLVDLDPVVHLLLGESNIYDTGGQRASVDWYQGSDQTFRWDWATSIHGMTIVMEVQADTAIGGAGFPQTAAPTATPFTATTTDHQVAMPDTVGPGDLLVIAAGFDGGPTITNPSGWTPLENVALSNRSAIVTVKVADGTEGGTTVNVVTSVAEQGVAQAYRITDWWGTIATGVAISARNEVGGVDTNNVPALNPGWGVEYSLWIAILNGATSSTNADVTTYPTDYLNGVETDTSTGSAGALVASARKENAVPSEDPDSFVLSVALAGSASRLLAIRPAAPVAGVSQIPNATVSNVGWDTAPLAGQAIHTYIATDDTDYITVTIP